MDLKLSMVFYYFYGWYFGFICPSQVLVLQCSLAADSFKSRSFHCGFFLRSSTTIQVGLGFPDFQSNSVKLFLLFVRKLFQNLEFQFETIENQAGSNILVFLTSRLVQIEKDEERKKEKTSKQNFTDFRFH